MSPVAVTLPLISWVTAKVPIFAPDDSVPEIEPPTVSEPIEPLTLSNPATLPVIKALFKLPAVIFNLPVTVSEPKIGGAAVPPALEEVPDWLPPCTVCCAVVPMVNVAIVPLA